jgi:nitroreductase
LFDLPFDKSPEIRSLWPFNMTHLPTKTLTEALHWRYATKKFDPSAKIPAATWAALEEALVLAPSSFGLQPWKFVIVQDGATREKLSAAAWGQRQPVDCSHFVVFAGRKGLDMGDIKAFLERTAEVRGSTLDSLKAYGDVITGFAERGRKEGWIDAWAAKQAYIALGGLMTAAALLGVDACPMEGLDPAKFNEILGLTEKGYAALCACALGYRAADDKYAKLPKVRYKAEDVIVHV